MKSLRTFPLFAAALCAASAIAILAAVPAQAWVTKYAEPAYTKTSANNTFWFQWTAIKGVNGSYDDYRYYVCASTTRNGVPVENHNGSAGPGATNCTNLLVNSAWTTPPTGTLKWQPFTTGTVLDDGQYYGMCNTGYHWYDFIWAIDNTSTDNCVGTTIDRNKPGIQVGVDGTADYTNNPLLALHIDYADATSPPWFGQNGVASNWTCVSRGGPCTPGGAPDPNCSVPNAYNSRINSFDCQANVSAQPDGDYYFCAFSADAAMPDNPNSSNQFGATSNSANLSGTACGHVVVDRQGPSVTATASKANAPVGTLISFSGSASDPSGLQGGYDWDFGDNTAHATGATAMHTYTQPGTYQVKLGAKDGAGNNGSGTVTVTITPASTGGNTGGNTGGGGSTPGTQTGTTGAAPTQQQVPTTTIIQTAGGGGGAQAASVGNLEIVAPKSFTAGKKSLLLALTPDTAGKLQVSMLKGAKVVARKGAVFGGGGTYSLKLKVPAKLKPGSYQLKFSYTADGSTRAVTKTIKLKVVKKKARSKVVAVTHERGALQGAPATLKQPK